MLARQYRFPAPAKQKETAREYLLTTV